MTTAEEMRRDFEAKLISYVIAMIKNGHGKATWKNNEQSYNWPKYKDLHQDWVINELKNLGYDVIFNKKSITVSCWHRK